MAALLRDAVNFTQFSLVYSVTAFIISGYIWPQAGMLNGTQYLHYLFPISHFAAPLRNIALSGNTSIVWPNILALLLLGSCFGGISYLLLRRAAAKTSPLAKDSEQAA